jgi:hypothetical protein
VSTALTSDAFESHSSRQASFASDAISTSAAFASGASDATSPSDAFASLRQRQPTFASDASRISDALASGSSGAIPTSDALASHSSRQTSFASDATSPSDALASGATPTVFTSEAFASGAADGGTPSPDFFRLKFQQQPAVALLQEALLAGVTESTLKSWVQRYAKHWKWAEVAPQVRQALLLQAH